jgi:hypothetical protein
MPDLPSSLDHPLLALQVADYPSPASRNRNCYSSVPRAPLSLANRL